jgi:hypothetical protein
MALPRTGARSPGRAVPTRSWALPSTTRRISVRRVPSGVTESPAVPALTPRGHARMTRNAKRRDMAVRLLAHAVAELPFLVVALVEVAQGWRATQDDAVIAIRSWAVLGAHPPLLGQITQASACGAQYAYSPGPLQYWLLALPVRADPLHGVLWGAALAAAVGMAISVEAVWAVAGRIGVVVLAAATVIVTSTQVQVLINPVWNPNLGLVWFVTTCLTGWAVATRRFGWWPLCVVAASIAAQTHLEYAAPSVAVAVLAPVCAGARRRPSSWRWLPVGVGLGVGCWAVPLAQQVTGSPGNMTVLLRCVGSAHSVGTVFGLKALASAVLPPPLWWHAPPTGTTQSIVSALSRAPAAIGVASLALLVVIGVLAWRHDRFALATLAGIALVGGAAAAWALGAVPYANRAELGYLDGILWPVGIFIWSVVLWAAIAGATAVARRLASSRHVPPSRDTAWLVAVVSVAVAGGAAANAAAVGAGATAAALRASGGPHGFVGTANAARAIQRAVPRGPLLVGVGTHGAYASYALLFGTVWALTSDGRQVTVSKPFRGPIEPPAYWVPGSRPVSAAVSSDGSVTRVNVGPNPRR